MATRPPAYVVVSADPERRRDWARTFDRSVARILECPGPLGACPLARGALRCAVLDEAELALYDLDSTLPSFLATLVRVYAHRSMLFARDTLTPGGRHQPAVKRFAIGRLPDDDACFGDLPR